MARGGVVRIGISGWTRPPLRSAFYPKSLPQKRERGTAGNRSRRRAGQGNSG